MARTKAQIEVTKHTTQLEPFHHKQAPSIQNRRIFCTLHSDVSNFVATQMNVT
jgi:hypothetical protein